VKKAKEENWCQKQLADKNLHQLCEKVDWDIALEAKAKVCAFCGEVLHWGNYKRKPRGGPLWERRYSLCCSGRDCRRRLTPPSVRFLGRRVYAGIVVVLVSAMNHGLSAQRIRRLREVLNIDVRTLKRWRQWWLETFVRSRFWVEARARLSPPVCEETLPWSLGQRFGFELSDRLLELMKFLSPITVSQPVF